MALSLILAAWSIEAVLGWPDGLYRRLGHPVTWIGRLIERLEHAGHRPGSSPARQRLVGLWLWCTVVGITVAVAWLLATLMSMVGVAGFWLEAIAASSLLASRSLYQHIRAVAIALGSGDLTAARRATAHVVGRDPALLDAPALSRAALESLAENTSDAVVAPLFWGVLLGLPGIAGYKAVNTLDSMIGHRSERYRYLGHVSARADDVANWIPARITGVLFVLVSARPRAGAVLWRDARHHRSPNAGWPEAALAGALERRLSGPRHYAGEAVDEPWLNADCRDPDVSDLFHGLRLYLCALVALASLGLLACHFR